MKITPRVWVMGGLFALFIACGYLLSQTPQAPDATTKTPERIVSMAPNITEILFEIGAGPQVIAVSAFTTHPPEATQRPKLGGLNQPGIEAIVALKPDLVLTKGRHMKLAEQAKPLSIPLIELPAANTLAEIRATIEQLGVISGHPERARALIARLDADLNALEQVEGAPTVLLVVYRDSQSIAGVYAAGLGTFHDELLQKIGARNALTEQSSGWLSLSLEVILESKPDVILELDTTGGLTSSDALSTWREALPTLPAVINGRVHVLTGDHLTIPGPRIIDVARDLSRALSTRD